KIQDVLQKLDHYYSLSTIDYSSYTKERAKQYYECRTNDEIERDTFGYIDIAVYESCLKTALNQAIELFQSNSKSDCIELFLTFLRNKIAESNSEKYPSNIDDDLCYYASDLFYSRT